MLQNIKKDKKSIIFFFSVWWISTKIRFSPLQSSFGESLNIKIMSAGLSFRGFSALWDFDIGQYFNIYETLNYWQISQLLLNSFALPKLQFWRFMHHIFYWCLTWLNLQDNAQKPCIFIEVSSFSDILKGLIKKTRIALIPSCIYQFQSDFTIVTVKDYIH